MNQLLGCPVTGHSWEGVIIEAIVAGSPCGTDLYFYRTRNGAEIDLLLVLPGNQRWDIKIKRSMAQKLAKDFHVAREDAELHAAFVAYVGTEQFPLNDKASVIDLEMVERLGETPTARGHRAIPAWELAEAASFVAAIGGGLTLF